MQIYANFYEHLQNMVGEMIFYERSHIILKSIRSVWKIRKITDLQKITFYLLCQF